MLRRHAVKIKTKSRARMTHPGAFSSRRHGRSATGVGLRMRARRAKAGGAVLHVLADHFLLLGGQDRLRGQDRLEIVMDQGRSGLRNRVPLRHDCGTVGMIRAKEFFQLNRTKGGLRPVWIVNISVLTMSLRRLSACSS